MYLTFAGAAQTVTGSKYLLESYSEKLLIDCGLFQGLKELRLKNWSPLPFDMRTLNAVCLTHAHIDHSGYLPLLVKNGYRGRIYCTQGTEKLCQILLPDAGHLQEEEANYANRKGYSKHHPARPLYTQADAELSLKSFTPIPWEEKFSPSPSFLVSFASAGHIIGAATIKVRVNGKVLLFSGDLGRQNDLIMRPPETTAHADYLILESTYGGRVHADRDPLGQLASILNKTFEQGGMVLVPSFAVGRAQSLLYALYLLREAGKIPQVPIYLDSPMAISASEIFCEFSSEHRIDPITARAACQSIHYIRSSEESKSLNQKSGPMVLIAASGMATGGRILHHLKHFGSEPKNTLLFTGFQAAGTRGAKLISGAQEVKIHGEMISIRAKLEQLDTLSAHADQSEILTWLKGFKAPPKTVFITHGELNESLALKRKIEEQFGWHCHIPTYGERVEF